MPLQPPRPVAFDGESGIKLRGEVLGDPSQRPILLLHGGGQTRHSWADTASRLVQDDWQVVSIDLRGHGDSDWSEDRAYAFEHYAADITALGPQFAQPPVFVGASLGGLAALLAEGMSNDPLAAGLVLVDVAPRMEAAGVKRILEFMTAYPDGFVSLEECADAVAAYNPRRPRPENVDGLAKNLRRGEDGRWRWHWDPGFLGIDRVTPGFEGQIDEAARSLRVPTLLVRGRMSDLLSEEGARHFLELAPHADFADVSKAGHMVAGDNNDVFTDAIRKFLNDKIER